MQHLYDDTAAHREYWEYWDAEINPSAWYHCGPCNGMGMRPCGDMCRECKGTGYRHALGQWLREKRLEAWCTRLAVREVVGRLRAILTRATMPRQHRRAG